MFACDVRFSVPRGAFASATISAFPNLEHERSAEPAPQRAVA
jgi:hypothetical protein